jgi:hypothetical protein
MTRDQDATAGLRCYNQIRRPHLLTGTCQQSAEKDISPNEFQDAFAIFGVEAMYGSYNEELSNSHIQECAAHNDQVNACSGDCGDQGSDVNTYGKLVMSDRDDLQNIIDEHTGSKKLNRQKRMLKSVAEEIGGGNPMSRLQFDCERCNGFNGLCSRTASTAQYKYGGTLLFYAYSVDFAAVPGYAGQLTSSNAECAVLCRQTNGCQVWIRETGLLLSSPSKNCDPSIAFPFNFDHIGYISNDPQFPFIHSSAWHHEFERPESRTGPSFASTCHP